MILKYAENFNGKFNTKFFTTIRNSLKIEEYNNTRINNEIVENLVKTYSYADNYHLACKSKIVDIKIYENILSIPTSIILTDTGLNYNDGCKLIEFFYGKQGLCLLTMQRIFE